MNIRCGCQSEYDCTHSQKCAHDYEAPVHKGRADYRCRLCGADITAELVLIAEADTLAGTLTQADEAGINGG